jgi:hypothetical protein
MGLFNKSGSGTGNEPRRRDTRSLITPAVLLRIQALVTAASGVARVPKAQEGSRAGSGYFQGLLNATPKKPELKVLAVRRGDDETTISVGITTPNGDMIEEFTTKGVLTEHNALATGADIAKVLRDPAAAGTCGQELLALTREPVGHRKAFMLGAGKRLQIESGEGR